MTNETDLTEADIERHRCRVHGGYHFHEAEVAAMVAEAEQTARAEACTRRHVEAAPPDDFDTTPAADLVLPYPADLYDGCPCSRCMATWSEFPRMALCPTCGNKRCPGAADHDNECSGSNEPGQSGSNYANPLREQRDEARREVERYSETIRAIGLRNMRLQREAREARAQAVQATTAAADLRARAAEAAEWCADREAYYGVRPDAYDEGARDAYGAAEDYVRWALKPATRTETGPTAAGSPKTAASRSPDLLGPQIGAEQ